MKRPCWLIGHVDRGGYGYCYCGACTYDPDFSEYGILTEIKYWYWQLRYGDIEFRIRQYFRRCPDCHKWELLFGKNVGNHRDCIPF